MRRLLAVLFAVALLAPLAVDVDAAHLGSGASLPATCTVGDTFTLLPSFELYDCRYAANTWVPRTTIHYSPRTLPDNTLTTIWSVSVPTSNTGCTVHMSFSYQATGGGNTVEHSGIVIATLNATFNNTLSVNGFLTYRVLNNNCGPLTEH